MAERVKYPNRTVWFSLQTGLMDKKAHAEHVERERLERLRFYGVMCDGLRMTTIEDFKTEFNITC